MDSQTCRNTILSSYQKWFCGNDIREILLADTAITEEVGTNIYPLVAPENVDGDFIIYAREKYAKEEAKMGVYSDDCQVVLTVISSDYDNAVYLAALLDNALVGKHIKEDGTVFRMRLLDSSEAYEDLKFIETLLFEIK